MLRLNSTLTIIILLLLLGCGGGSNAPGDQARLSPPAGQPDPAAAGPVRLLLSAEPIAAGEWSLMLSSEDTGDLYQIAGSIEFDPQAYEVLSAEAGGGLGGPDEAYFVNSGSTDGTLDFAYTSRFFGRLNSGNLNLLRLRVRPSGQFSLADFNLATDTDRIRLRDSARQDLEFSFGRSSQ